MNFRQKMGLFTVFGSIAVGDNFRQIKTLNTIRSMLKKVYGDKAQMFTLNTNWKTQILLSCCFVFVFV